jgi:pimeloyl-ACP methyl ester carboxylesterase
MKYYAIIASCLFSSLAYGATVGNDTQNPRNHDQTQPYQQQLVFYAPYCEIISGGFDSGNKILIRFANETFFAEDRWGLAFAGVYVVAIYEQKVLFKKYYDTYSAPGASLGLLHDIEQLPMGTFVIVAVKDEGTNHFGEAGERALHLIGVDQGLSKGRFRTSYFCIGVRGLARGMAIEELGMELLYYSGSKVGEEIPLTFLPEMGPLDRISITPGMHEGLFLGETEVIYYIPKYFNTETAEYLVCIHGAGKWHRPGAGGAPPFFGGIADIKNLVIIAPSFDCIFNWPPNRKKDMDDQGEFRDRRIIRDWHLWNFTTFLNGHNALRTDQKLIEIFAYFNAHLMKRDRFHLFGHSGGGQFVQRFATFYPEMIAKVVASSPGTLLFPDREIDYPHGLCMDNLEKTYGEQIKAEDLRLSDAEFDQLMDRFLDLRLILIAGEYETEQSHPKLDWQGQGTVDKTRNYFKAMKQEHERLIRLGIRSPHKPFRFEFHVIPGVGHDAAAGASKALQLMFPVDQVVKKGKVLDLDFIQKRPRDRSPHKNEFTSQRPPHIRNGRAIFLPGRKQYLQSKLVRSSSLLGCTEMSIRLRIRMTRNPRRHSYARILQTCDSQWWGTCINVFETNRIKVMVETTARNTSLAIKYGRARSPALVSNTRVDDGNWHEVLLVYTGSMIKLFIDGKQEGSIAWDGAIVNFDQIHLGYVPSNGFYFDGEVSELEIYGHSLLP